jgi:hypothetical protein
MVEPLGSVAGANRDGADRPDWRRRGALTRRHQADPPREPLRQFQPSLTGLDRPTLPRQYPDGADEWQRACEVQPVDCVRMVHVRRRFYELAVAGSAAIASEALTRIAELYRIESEIRGVSAAERCRIRQIKSRPILDALEPWLRGKLGLISQTSKLAEAIRYLLAEQNRARCIGSVGLEDTLRKIQPDCANLSHGRLPQVVFNTSTVAHRGRWGASTSSRRQPMLTAERTMTRQVILAELTEKAARRA